MPARNSITFLGTGDGWPSPDRHHTALLLRLAGKSILLDCGEPCSHTLKRRGIDFNSLDAIVVTHTHSDHVGGLPMLLQSMWLERRTRPLPIWLPRHTIQPLRRWLDSCYLFEPLLGFRIVWRPLPTTRTVRIGAVRFRAHRTTHLDGFRARFAKQYRSVGFDAYAIELSTANRRVVYSADIGSPRDLEPALQEPVDLLIVELAHFRPAILLKMLQSRSIKQVAFTHLGRPMHARRKKLRALAKRALGKCQVSFPVDEQSLKY